MLLDGGAGTDVLTGGQADDFIILHQGDDQGYGGPGSDRYQMTFNSTLTVRRLLRAESVGLFADSLWSYV